KSKFLKFLLYPMYLLAFNHLNQIVVFQNKDDAKVLISWGVIKSHKVRFIKGSGVRLKNFSNLDDRKGMPTVCFAAR